MNITTKPMLARVRHLMPTEELCLLKVYEITERQAMKLIQLLGVKHAPVDVSIFAELPGVEVELKPRQAMKGKPSWSRPKGDGWKIEICKDDPLSVRRFNVAREIKRIIDLTLLDVAYKGFHCPDEHHFRQKIESICDHFAACFLAPARTVRRKWADGMQSAEDLAWHFRVPVEVMERRIRQLRLDDSGTSPSALADDCEHGR